MKREELSILKKALNGPHQVWYPVKPVCLFFGIHYRNQVARIKRDPILSQQCQKSGTLGMDGRKRTSYVLSKAAFLRWVELINARTVNPEMQEKFQRFQFLIHDYLYGNAEKEEAMRVHFLRLRKLQRLYAKVGREIQRERHIWENYWKERYGSQRQDLLDNDQ